MPEKREATPGAFKLPAGAKNKEEFEALKIRVDELEKKIEYLLTTGGKKKAA